MFGLSSAASTSLQIISAEVGEAYAGVVAELSVKIANAGVDTTLQTVSRRRLKKRQRKRRPAELPPCPSFPERRRTSLWDPLLAYT
jgi:hypothetical protein